MVRRIPKSFTVEVRKSGRKPGVIASFLQGGSISAFTPDDQPRVIWPGLDAERAPAKDVQQSAAKPQAFAGRILPALDQPEPARAIPEPQAVEDSQAEPALPLNEYVPFEASAANQVEAAAIPSAIEGMPVPVAVVAMTMAATLILRQGRKRLPRESFRLGERWKARIPAVALTTGKPSKKQMRRDGNWSP